MKVFIFISVAILQSFIALNVSAAEPAPLQGLDTYVHKAMKEWKTPGVAIAVVKDGKVVLAKGYGVRELGKPERCGVRSCFLPLVFSFS